jgi:hypothetical protein
MIDRGCPALSFYRINWYVWVKNFEVKWTEMQMISCHPFHKLNAQLWSKSLFISHHVYIIKFHTAWTCRFLFTLTISSVHLWYYTKWRRWKYQEPTERKFIFIFLLFKKVVFPKKLFISEKWVWKGYVSSRIYFITLLFSCQTAPCIVDRFTKWNLQNTQATLCMYILGN